MGITSCF